MKTTKNKKWLSTAAYQKLLDAKALAVKVKRKPKPKDKALAAWEKDQRRAHADVHFYVERRGTTSVVVAYGSKAGTRYGEHQSIKEPA